MSTLMFFVFYFSCFALVSASTLYASLLNSSYVNPVFEQSRSNIERDSVASVRHLVAHDGIGNDTHWKADNAWTTVAQWDLQQKTRTFYTDSSDALAYDSKHQSGCFDFWKVSLVDCFNDDAASAALGSREGYAAAWFDWFIANHGFINETVISEGYLKGTYYLNNTLKPTCNSRNIYGGIHWQNGVPGATDNSAATDTSIDSGSTIDYALLSIKLCRTTGNTSYCDRAYDALQFFERFFVDAETGFVNIQYWSLVNRDSNDATKPSVFGGKLTDPYTARGSKEQASQWQL
ncbi:hypothetical protein M409DRAFT_22898 [Zasmidium cellare ATCC 36951]|uniref:Glycoside hydrolase family 76 protein n=1 Tax=Zasmidium cellare ATCC 36951 TaxID=1080233 RepID=A0A6A6CJQ4_ZASCE|nr:uncharacterized protein M409DRAFT_22898 [Zasmidium cellare ATCC 36951]KAF2166843.1 hypothetical protein M409DRAFT_22898 [Zasmidium cellare ATCC 36951]